MSTITRYIVATLDGNGGWDEDKEEYDGDRTGHQQALNEAQRVHGRLIERTYTFDDSEMIDDFSRIVCKTCNGQGGTAFGHDSQVDCEDCDTEGYVTGEEAEAKGWPLDEWEENMHAEAT